MVSRVPSCPPNRSRARLASSVAALALCTIAAADPIVAITTPAPLLGTQQLLEFDSGSPSVATPGIPITGLATGEILLSIDFRPATGELFGLGSSGRLYLIDPVTAAVTPRGEGTFAITLRGSYFGFNFNPVLDLIRVTSNAGQNFRLDPNDGAVVDFDPNVAGVQPDANLRFAPGDQSEASTPRVVASAYTNSYYGAATTTLFNIDSALNVLLRQEPANEGWLHTICGISVTFARDVIGFDIAPRENTAFVTGPGSLPNLTGFYTLDLESGLAAFIGNIGLAPVRIKSIAVRPSACPCDFNHDRALNSQDFFDFLPPFFASEVRCDVNRDGTVNSQDFFEFLACFLDHPGDCESR